MPIVSLVRSSRVRQELVKYCQYGHLYCKETKVWTTVGWTPKGRSGTGLCRAPTGYCTKEQGYVYIDKDTKHWRHRYVIGGDHSRSVKGAPTVLQEELKNRVPAELLSGILGALRQQ